MKWSSRKLWLAMFWQAVNTALLVHGVLPVPAYESLTWLLLGGYFVGNVAVEYIAGRQGGR
jgi:hypothetical protein